MAELEFADIKIAIMLVSVVYMVQLIVWAHAIHAGGKILQRNHLKMVDDFKRIHHTYINTFKGSKKKPIEDPTLNQMWERFEEVKKR